MKKIITLLSSSLLLFGSQVPLSSQKNSQKLYNFCENTTYRASVFESGEEYYSKYTNLIGNTIYKNSVTLKNTFYFPNETYIGKDGDTGVFVKDNIVHNLVFIVDGNVSDKKEIEISGKGYHTVKVSTYYEENGIKKVSKSYLEEFTFFISPLKEELTIGQNKYYFEYYSSFDALVKDIESHILVYKDGSTFKTTLDKGTIEAIRYNYNEVMYEYNLETKYVNDLVLNDIDVPLTVTSSRSKEEAKETYELLPTSNKDFVIDYVDLVGKDESLDYKSLVKDLVTSNEVKGDYDLFNGVAIKMTKGETSVVYKEDDLLEEGTPFSRTVHDEKGDIDYKSLFDKFVVSPDKIDLKDGTWNLVNDTNSLLSVTLPDYLGTKVEIKKDIYLFDYRIMNEEARFSLRLDQEKERSFLSFKDIDLTSSELINTAPFVSISLPTYNLLINDYEGITSQTIQKYRVNTKLPGTYQNTYQITYKSNKLKETTYNETFKVIDDISPSIIARYDVFYFDKIDKSTFLDNYLNYIRFVDNVGVDYSSVKVSTPDNFMSDKETYFLVEVKDTSGNTTQKSFKVVEKSIDTRSDFEKGWDTFCYNWGHFFRELFGVNL